MVCKPQSSIKNITELVNYTKGAIKPFWPNLKQQVYLGSDEFVSSHLLNADLEEGDMQEIPVKQRQAKPLSLTEYEANEPTRNDAIVAEFTSGGFTQKEIGKHFGLHYSRISRIVTKGKT